MTNEVEKMTGQELVDELMRAVIEDTFCGEIRNELLRRLASAVPAGTTEKDYQSLASGLTNLYISIKNTPPSEQDKAVKVFLERELERFFVGGSAGPRCPKCGSYKVHYYSTECLVRCESCRQPTAAWKLADFAQFFSPSPATPRCSLVLGDNTICDKPQGHDGPHGTDTIIRCHTCKSTLLYHREDGAIVVYHTCNALASPATEGQPPRCEYIFRDIGNGLRCDKEKGHTGDHHATMGSIKEGIHVEDPEPAAVPVAGKVEEVARKICSELYLCFGKRHLVVSPLLEKSSRELVGALLRPYLQVSQPHKDMDEIILRAVDKCNPATDGERFCLYNIIETAINESRQVSQPPAIPSIETLARRAWEKRQAMFKCYDSWDEVGAADKQVYLEAASRYREVFMEFAPVAPVSGNGTEPEKHK